MYAGLARGGRRDCWDILSRPVSSKKKGGNKKGILVAKTFDIGMKKI